MMYVTYVINLSHENDTGMSCQNSCFINKNGKQLLQMSTIMHEIRSV